MRRARLRRPPDVDELERQIAMDDDLSAVLRAHLYLEVIVNASLKLDGVSDAASARLSVSKRVDRAIAAERIPEAYKPVLLAINDLRNRFAHEWYAKLTLDDVVAVDRAMSFPSADARAEFISAHPDRPTEGLAFVFGILFGYLVRTTDVGFRG